MIYNLNLFEQIPKLSPNNRAKKNTISVDFLNLFLNEFEKILQIKNKLKSE